MKKIITKITFLFAILLIGNSIAAQKFVMKEGVINHDDQQRACIVVQIEPQPKNVKDNLKDWVKDEYDVKLKGFGFLVNKDVLSGEQVTIPSISKNAMDLYAEVVENDGGSQISIFGSFGYNIHITPEKYPTEFRAMKSMTLDFLSDFLPNFYQNRIEDTQELISDLEKERKNLKEDLADNLDEIAKLKKENKELSKEMQAKGAQLKDASKTLEIQKEKSKEVDKKLKTKGKKKNNK